MALVHRKAAHAACPDYRAAESSLLEPQEHHCHYLELEWERAGVEARLAKWEQRGTCNGHVIDLYDRLEEIEKQQVASLLRRGQEV